jgi:hypothetical protein
VYVAELDEENPARDFRLGFDGVGRLLELVELRFDSGHELVIHAVKGRRQYLNLISDWRFRMPEGRDVRSLSHRHPAGSRAHFWAPTTRTLPCTPRRC